MTVFPLEILKNKTQTAMKTLHCLVLPRLRDGRPTFSEPLFRISTAPHGCLSANIPQHALRWRSGCVFVRNASMKVFISYCIRWSTGNDVRYTAHHYAHNVPHVELRYRYSRYSDPSRIRFIVKTARIASGKIACGTDVVISRLANTC